VWFYCFYPIPNWGFRDVFSGHQPFVASLSDTWQQLHMVARHLAACSCLALENIGVWHLVLGNLGSLQILVAMHLVDWLRVPETLELCSLALQSLIPWDLTAGLLALGILRQLILAAWCLNFSFFLIFY
jgi:hypothetical protein